jgi:hypothetical protein
MLSLMRKGEALGVWCSGAKEALVLDQKGRRSREAR